MKTLITDLNKLLNKVEYLSDIDSKMSDLIIAAKEMSEFSDNFGDSMAGLAANQIGIDLPLICIKKDKLNFYVNPIYGPSYGTKTTGVIEGCLSFPGLTCATYRFKTIELSGYKLCIETESYKEIDESRGPRDSYVYQHEIDHLHGITMLDRAHEIFPPNPPSKAVYKITDMEDYCVAGSNETLFHKKPIDPNTLRKYYIVGVLK